MQYACFYILSPCESQTLITSPSRFAVIPPIKTPPSRSLPTVDTHQTDETMTVCVYTRRPDTRREDVIAEVDEGGTNLRCVVKFNGDQTAFVLRYKLFAPARLNVSKVSCPVSCMMAGSRFPEGSAVKKLHTKPLSLHKMSKCSTQHPNCR